MGNCASGFMCVAKGARTMAKITADEARTKLMNHNPRVIYNAHAQEDQIINSIWDFDAKDIADLIRAQDDALNKATKIMGRECPADCGLKQCGCATSGTSATKKVRQCWIDYWLEGR
ncbi:MAG: hypothetical protein H6Q73_177 [Firmicutes bacterium]|nr:hypothetical protein [Bacillota bacterium]